MLFNTFQFFVFFLVVAGLYFALPHRFRWMLLLAASYYFYMCWSVKYIAVIVAITLIDYCAGIRIEQARGRRRRLFLALSIVSNFGLLFVFKYAGFFGLGFTRHWLLPVGLSFHTFQAVSYTIDVYRGKVPAERNLGVYALYVAFFPQMVAGPIERPGHLLPQFHEEKRFDRTRAISGLRTALWGLIKKTVVADLAAPAVNTVYAHPRGFPGPMLALATALFAVQIYCDFSGYSDMAIGMARIMGFDLTINFRQPYFATSIADFWRRWHISLSSWFRDYVYLPLGGNRVPASRWAVNIMIVFLLSGFWHGANWTFLIWGALHGFYVLAAVWTRGAAGENACSPIRFPRLRALQQIVFTDLLVTFAWIFFRARNTSDALYVAGHLWDFRGFRTEQLFLAGLPRFEMIFLLFAITAVFICEYLRSHPLQNRGSLWERRVFRWPVYAAGVYSVVFFGVFQRVEFIYFQF